MASAYGKPIQWTDHGRTRFAIDFGVIQGKRRRVYGSADAWGQRQVFSSAAERDVELARIRAVLRDRGDLLAALAPYFREFSTVLSFGACWDRYVEHQEHQAETGKIGAAHLRQIHRHTRWDVIPLRHRTAAEISYAVLEDWVLWLARDRKLAPRSQRHALGAVMTCLNWLVRRGELERVPQAPSIEVPEHAPVLLSDATQRAILAAVPKLERGIFLALCLMALRTREARLVDASSYRDGIIHFETTKRKRVKSLPCPPEVEEWLEMFVTPSLRLAGRPLFVNPRARRGRNPSQRWMPTALKEAWRRAQMKALGRVIAPLQEGARHSRATLWLREGHSIQAVQAVLDHRSISTTQIYAKLSGQAVVDVLRPKRRG